MLARLLSLTIDKLFLASALLAIVSTIYLSFMLATGRMGLSALIAILGSALILLPLYLCRNSDFLNRLLSYLSRGISESKRVFWILVVLGLALRVLWYLVYPSRPQSDGIVYLSLADNLAQGLAYLDDRGDYAYWPPGYSFFLMPFVYAFGKAAWLTIVLNLLLFVAAAWTAKGLLSQALGTPKGNLAVALLAVWPNLIFSAPAASKELLALPLLTAAVWTYLIAVEGRRSVWGFSLLTGLLLGASSLTQPSLMLLPAAFAVHLFVAQVRVGRALAVLGLTVAGMIMVISPWSNRNQAVLGASVPISTNGGDVFYRANNADATGGYQAKAEVDLRKFGEIERGKLGYELGSKWIRENPVLFAQLAVKKTIIFLGDNSYGVYWNLKRSLHVSDGQFVLFKAVSNLGWIALWLLILLPAFKTGWSWRAPVTVLIQTIFLYFFLIDCVYEAGSRHHMPLAGLLAVLMAGAFSRQDVGFAENPDRPKAPSAA
ncbi:MAG: glycosyltransferase family 39 protein [Burkholderiaceae bacterium]|nr:glycosyltransferase family 39 protein [Burkholderiaceae bacterium]